MDNKTYYYDPIYNQIVLPNVSQFGGSSETHKLLRATPSDNIKTDLYKAIHEVLKNDNYDRLSFLNQSGIAWLVFPSATHTRFAHSLGCYHLGNLALESVHVYSVKKEIRLKLSDWLSMESPDANPDSGNLYYQCLFLVSLLCHDIGHFPFSHTMELNHEIDIDKSHEERISSILDDRFYQSFCKFHNCGQNNDTNNMKCFKDALEYLISGTESDSYERDCLPTDPDKLKFHRCKILVMKKLVSGLLDLDRIDHYLRDSFFTGIRLANFNIEQLLRGMTFIIPEILGSVDLALNRDALIHAKNLLHSKEQISDAIFENPDVINYEIILNQCITKYKKSVPDKLFCEVYGMRDWQLLNTLYVYMVKDTNGKDKPVYDKDRKMFERILEKKPLCFIGKFIIRGNYSVEYGANGEINFKYADDKEHLSAIADFYRFTLCINMMEENPILQQESDVSQLIKSDLIGMKLNLLQLTYRDDQHLLVLLMKYLFSHKLHEHDNNVIEFTEIKYKLWKLAGQSFKRKLTNAVKRTFAKRLNEKFNTDLMPSNNGPYDEKIFYFKFSKKFLDFYKLSQDVEDYANVVIDMQKDSKGSYGRVASDVKEREFLRMIAAQDIKSRINMWLYSDQELSDYERGVINKSIKECGFISVRG